VSIFFLEGNLILLNHHYQNIYRWA